MKMMRVLDFANLVAILSAITDASTIKKRQFCPLPGSVCANPDLITPPYTDDSSTVQNVTEIPNIINLNHTSIAINGTNTISINGTNILVNGSIPIPSPPPDLPDNATEINIEAAFKAEQESDIHQRNHISCPGSVYGVVAQMIQEAALLAKAGEAAAKAGGFPFNFFFPAPYNETAQQILSRAADALQNRGERILYSCHDWDGACTTKGVRAWAGTRNVHVPDTQGGTGGHDETISVVTLCKKTLGWPFNNWPCSEPPVHYDTSAHVILHEVLHFKNITLGRKIGDVVYGIDACHALLVGEAQGTPGPESSADCIAAFAGYAWELGFGRDEARHGWRGEPCPGKWGPPLVYPAMISMERR